MKPLLVPLLGLLAELAKATPHPKLNPVVPSIIDEALIFAYSHGVATDLESVKLDQVNRLLSKVSVRIGQPGRCPQLTIAGGEVEGSAECCPQ